MSSRPRRRRRRVSGSVWKGKVPPSSVSTRPAAKSTTTLRPPGAARANNSATAAAGKVTSSKPLLTLLVEKMSAKLGAITQRKPYSSSAHTACSRLDPQPKLSRASSTVAPWYSGAFRTKSPLMRRSFGVLPMTPSSR